MIWKVFTLNFKFPCKLNTSKNDKIYWFFLSNRIEDQESGSSDNFRMGPWSWQQQQNSITKMHEMLWEFLFLLSPDQWEFPITERGLGILHTEPQKNTKIRVVSTKTLPQDDSLDSSPEKQNVSWGFLPHLNQGVLRVLFLFASLSSSGKVLQLVAALKVKWKAWKGICTCWVLG